MASGSGGKYFCLVPSCANTYQSTPEKSFFLVPYDVQRRTKWTEAIGMTPGKYAARTSLHVCEDHFDLPNDMENYWRWKIMGGHKKLKTDVVPHLQLSHSDSVVEQGVYAKENISPEQGEESQGVKRPLQEINTVGNTLGHAHRRSRAIQCLITHRASKMVCERGTNTLRKVCTDKATSTTCTRSLYRKEALDESASSTTQHSTDEYSPSCTSDMDMDSMEEDGLTDRMKQLSLEVTMYYSKIKPVLYMGLPAESYFVVERLLRYVHCTYRDIYLVLRKIRLDQTFQQLGDSFGMSESNASRIFVNTIRLIAPYLKTLIPTNLSRERVKLLLPIPFRARYAKVNHIIDCFEISIQKPTNPIKQALTWSEYKKANTMKYLIASTPDGIVNYISCGYGGRASDALIVKESGFLETLIPNTAVMADRGFKHVEYMLLERQCVLVRPPSVEQGTKSSKEEVLETRRIASLRIHVERVIRRIREFAMLVPHAALHHNLISVLDDILITVCGLINLQSSLIKTAFED